MKQQTLAMAADQQSQYRLVARFERIYSRLGARSRGE
jgi:hypothetical protein